ncbi:hypothetical protein [Enterococcus mundtii]|uniref:hypothetical protein n=1 Tax=Enterococcus mundtii TaxID=53346 RepID=UPI0032DED4BE
MKLSQIRKEYHFRQTTFYKWLNDTGLIKKESSGYVIGPNAITGMETKFSGYITEDGERATVVSIDNNQVSHLVDMYLSSGYDKLYSDSYLKNTYSDKKTITEEESNLIIGLLLEEMKRKIEERWQGSFGLRHMSNEDLIMGSLREIHEDPEISEGHSSEAFAATLEIEGLYNLIKKLR